MNIPLNGRVAIIDNELNQAIPLMRVFAKNSIPYLFYKGDDLEFLPDEGNAPNDIRVLFLDINLLNERTPSEKEIKATLIGVLKRVISTDNFPYSLVYWSRQEDEYSDLVKGIFENELSDRKPINLIPFVKSDFFPNFSNEEERTEVDIVARLHEIIASQPAYSHLLRWENIVHQSADQTLQSIFSSYHQFENWENNANFIFNKLGVSYLGKHFEDCNPTEKVQGSFIALNAVYRDTLEHLVYQVEFDNPVNLEFDSSTVSDKSVEINRKLNFSDRVSNLREPGSVVVFVEDEFFPRLLNGVLSLFRLRRSLKDSDNTIDERELKKQADLRFKELKIEIKRSWVKIAVVVTPVCDFVQKKDSVFDRMVSGLLIPEEFRDYLDDKSEAVYVFPFSVEHEGRKYLVVLDFRYFSTIDLGEKNIQGLFRIRQELLSEIQSKLARHITRQGILFLDERI